MIATWVLLAQTANFTGSPDYLAQYGPFAPFAFGCLVIIGVLWRKVEAERTAKDEVTEKLVRLTEQALSMGEKNAEILPEMRRTVDANTDVMRELAMQTVKGRGRG